jgi:hypothetical protein
MNSGLQPVKITLAAGAEDGVNVSAGRFFCVKEASAGAFEIALDDGAFLPWDSGMAYAVADAAEPFRQIRLRNASSNPITFQIIVGTGRVYDQRLTVVASRVGDSLALDGEDGTGISAPTGGTGIRGFLSGIYDRLKTAGPIGVLVAATNTALDAIDTLCTSILTGVAAISAQLPTTLGPKTKANSLSVTGPTFTASIVTAQTDATGTNWVDFGSAACVALDIVNSTGTALEYRRGGAGSSIQIASGASRTVEGIANANEISVRRVDTSNTQVTVTAEALT